MSPRPLLSELSGVPRTLLWTAYCRAEMARAGQLHDPHAIRICEAMDLDLAKEFGRPDPCFAKRAQAFDRRLRIFLEKNPGSDVVSLGEGLETQRYRVSGYNRWISVDLPEAIRVREFFLPSGPAFVHRAMSALDVDWLDELESPKCFIEAQGLFMYLEPHRVRSLLETIVHRVSGTLMFDVVPPWVAWGSRLRPPLTLRFRMPVMPWGVSPRRLASLLPTWAERPVDVELIPIDLPRVPISRMPFGFKAQTVAAHVMF
ncbi:MAG: class I SAM-dependent methyltransferase [Myxococcota bacterium]